jgi:hypothetical protein
MLPDAEQGRAWAGKKRVRTLNVAGPRESSCPGIHDEAAALLRRILAPHGPGDSG